MKKYKIGIFGGTFDPVHEGHVNLAYDAVKSLNLQKLYIVPRGISDFKDNEALPAPFRAAMAEKAFRKIPVCEVIRPEVMRYGKASFTADLLLYLKEIYPHPDVFYIKNKKGKIKKTYARPVFYLITGSDIPAEFHLWKQPEIIAENAVLAVALREEEYDINILKKELKALRRVYPGLKTKIIQSDTIEISSTMIRQSQDYLSHVPKPAAKFYQEQHLADWHDDMKVLEPAERKVLEENMALLYRLLPERRIIHSLNVMRYAVKLAAIHKCDTFKAAFAGLWHDCAKYMPLETQYALAAEIHHDYLDLLKGLPAPDRAGKDAAIVHGPAAAAFLKLYCHINDDEIAKAIYFHSCLRPGASDMEKILYVSDKVEYGRKFKDLEPLRQTALKNLDKAAYEVMSEVALNVKKDLHPLSKAYLKEEEMKKLNG